jgi:ribosomal protein S18 acetylase RimI-like enzyme
MDYELVSLSQLDEDGLRHLAALHHSVMKTLLSDLGLPIVLRYYQAAQSDPDVIGLCAVSASGEVLGWAIGSPHPEMINARLRRPVVWFILQMVRLTFTRPGVLWQLITSVFSSAGETGLKVDAIELTYIGTAADQRGRGLGKELLNAFMESSRAKGYRSVILSVEVENEPAIAMYEKAGFEIIKTFSEGRYQRHRMEMVLV